MIDVIPRNFIHLGQNTTLFSHMYNLGSVNYDILQKKNKSKVFLYISYTLKIGYSRKYIWKMVFHIFIWNLGSKVLVNSTNYTIWNLSCFFLSLTRYIRSERSIILINFCLSIISSNILILVGQTQTHNKVWLLMPPVLFVCLFCI